MDVKQARQTLESVRAPDVVEDISDGLDALAQTFREMSLSEGGQPFGDIAHRLSRYSDEVRDLIPCLGTEDFEKDSWKDAFSWEPSTETVKDLFERLYERGDLVSEQYRESWFKLLDALTEDGGWVSRLDLARLEEAKRRKPRKPKKD